MARLISIPVEIAHTMTYRVCYGDTDRMDRVYYANYLVFAERARTELMRAADLPYNALEASGLFLPVRACQVRYAGYATYDDLLTFHSWVTRLRHATVTFVTAIAKDKDPAPLVTVEVELACVTRDGQPTAFPVEARVAIARYQIEPTP